MPIGVYPHKPIPPEVRAKMSAAHKGKVKTDEHLKNISIALTGRKLSVEHCAKISAGQKGRTSPRKGKKNSPEHIAKFAASMRGRTLSEEHKEKLRQASILNNSARHFPKGKSWNKGLKVGDHPSIIGGARHYLWKGTTPWHRCMRVSPEYRVWREAVICRDKICQKHLNGCVNLVAHHIRNFIEFTEGRFDVSNGVTLCKESHKEFHDKYGKTKNTRDQLTEFLDKQPQPTAPQPPPSNGNAANTPLTGSSSG